jgi:integrase
MPHLKANALIIKAAAKGPRGTFTIEGHPGLYLQARGDGNGSWVIRYRVEGKQKEHTLHNDARNADFDKIKDAKDEWRLAARVQNRDLKAEQIAEAEAKRLTDEAASRTFGSVFEVWLAHTGKRRKRALSARTEEEYRRIYKLHIHERLGTKPLAKLTKSEIATAVEAVRRATTDPTRGQRGTQVLKALKIIRPVCEFAIDNEWLAHNPCRGIDDPVPRDNPHGKGTRPLTNEELRILWNEMPTAMPAPIVRVLKLTILLGRRISEIAGAERHDLRLDQATPVLIIPASREGNKAKREDAIPLPSLALKLVREALAEGTPEDPLFVGASDRGTASHAFMMFRRAIAGTW